MKPIYFLLQSCQYWLARRLKFTGSLNWSRGLAGCIPVEFKGLDGHLLTAQLPWDTVRRTSAGPIQGEFAPWPLINLKPFIRAENAGFYPCANQAMRPLNKATWFLFYVC